MVKPSMKYVNDVKKVSNQKCVSICKEQIKGGMNIQKEVMGYKKKGNEKVEQMMINPCQYNKGKSYHQ